MTVRTMWKGSITFGLVNVPVKMFSATESHDIKFRHLHAECKTPMKYTRSCPSCEREIEWKELVKGYEIEPNRFVILSEEEMEAIKPAKSRSISIRQFVRMEEIDPIYFQKAYYLSPEETGFKGYQLLQQAMAETGKIALASFILRETEHFAAIRTYQQHLVLETLFYPDEVRATTLLPELQPINFDQNELDMARLLIDNLSAPFQPELFHDEYREHMMNAITQKAAGEQIFTVSEKEPEHIADLMKALQASLDLVQESRSEHPNESLREVVGIHPQPDRPAKRRRKS